MIVVLFTWLICVVVICASGWWFVLYVRLWVCLLERLFGVINSVVWFCFGFAFYSYLVVFYIVVCRCILIVVVFGWFTCGCLQYVFVISGICYFVLADCDLFKTGFVTDCLSLVFDWLLGAAGFVVVYLVFGLLVWLVVFDNCGLCWIWL